MDALTQGRREQQQMQSESPLRVGTEADAEMMQSGVLRGYPPCDVLHFLSNCYNLKTEAEVFASKLRGIVTAHVSGRVVIAVPCPSCCRSIVGGDVRAILSGYQWNVRLMTAAADLKLMCGPIAGMTTREEVDAAHRILDELTTGHWSEDAGLVALKIFKLTQEKTPVSLSSKGVERYGRDTFEGVVKTISGLPSFEVAWLRHANRTSCFGRGPQLSGRVLPFPTVGAAVAAGAAEVNMTRDFSRPPLPTAKWVVPLQDVHVLSQAERSLGHSRRYNTDCNAQAPEPALHA